LERRRTALRRIADLGLITLLVAYVNVAVASMWTTPWLLALAFTLPPLVLGLRLGDPRRALAFAATGLVLGPLTEISCILSGLWTYGETGGLPLVPAWIFPLWSCFPAALWIVVRSVLGRAPRSVCQPLHLTLILLGLAIEVFLFAWLGHSTPLTLAAVLPLCALVLLLVRRLEAAVIFLAGGLIGPLCESLPITAGAWVYVQPEILGMPAWLPVGYSLFSLFTALAAEQIGALALQPRRSPALDPSPADG